MSADAALERVQALRAETPLAAALRSLKAVDAVLLTLTVFDGYSIGEAAAQVGLTDGTARTRLHRARQRLRSLLDSPDDTDTPDRTITLAGEDPR